jgi:heme exporter protein C
MVLFHKFFTAKTFFRIADPVLPFAVIAWIVTFAVAIYFALVASPPDYQQGEAVRMMYVHVPAAWMALGIYCFMALANASGFIWKNPFSFILSTSAAPIGACFCFLCLVTGSLWGKPIWGTWWVWDARLTSMLILFFFYIGYLVLYHTYDQKEKGEKAAALLSLVGIVNIPIIKFSVNWWNTLHQPASLLRKGGIAIAPQMLAPLLLMFASYLLFFIVLLTIRAKTETLSRKLEHKQLRQMV